MSGSARPMPNDVVDVAIVGAGPAGLSAALELRRRGTARVMVLDREAEAGGTPRQCDHPTFGVREFGRLLGGPAYARRLVVAAERAGVDIRTRHSVVALHPEGRLEVATPEGPISIQARRILLATGLREMPRSSRLIGGDRPVGIVNTGALQGFLHHGGLLPFRRPVVVGTELVSLSAIATCLEHGIRPVAVVESGHRPTVRWPLGLFPRLAGIPLRYASEVTAVSGLGRVEAVTVRRSDGREQPIACDGLLLTGGFVPEASLVRASHLLLDAGTAGPSVDQFARCSDPSYFAAGNVLRGVETAGWCLREGRRIAAWVAADLAGHLPKAERAVNVRRGPGIKLIVPQRIALPAQGDAARFQLRVQEVVRGRLVLIACGKTLWSRWIGALPERRILIDFATAELPNEADEITVGIVGR